MEISADRIRKQPTTKGIANMKRIATGLGLVGLMATMMISGRLRASETHVDDDGVTLASLAGKFAARGSGFFTLCFNLGAPISCSSVSPVPLPVPFNTTQISHITRDEAGNFCEVRILTNAPVSGTISPVAVNTRINVGTPISFDPTTGSGTASFSQNSGGSCIGAAFDSIGATLIATGSISFVASNSGKRIESIVTSFSAVAGNVKGLVFSQTAIRQ